MAISPLEPGDRASIIKPGSSKYGDEVEVTDPSWYGMVKVAHEEGVKSYLAEHLSKLEAPACSGGVEGSEEAGQEGQGE